MAQTLSIICLITYVAPHFCYISLRNIVLLEECGSGWGNHGKHKECAIECAAFTNHQNGVWENLQIPFQSPFCENIACEIIATYPLCWIPFRHTLAYILLSLYVCSLLFPRIHRLRMVKNANPVLELMSSRIRWKSFAAPYVECKKVVPAIVTTNTWIPTSRTDLTCVSDVRRANTASSLSRFHTWGATEWTIMCVMQHIERGYFPAVGFHR